MHADPPIDPRGQRFAAAFTSVVLALVLVTEGSLSMALLALQTAVFAVGAIVGVRRSPYALLYARTLRPRLGPPAHTEEPQPPRFAQAVGLVFAVVGLVGFATGLPALALAATGLALTAAVLNAAFGFCLGCEMYLLIRRTFPTDHRTNSNRATEPTEVSA
jgi:hypothetical protein